MLICEKEPISHPMPTSRNLRTADGADAAGIAAQAAEISDDAGLSEPSNLAGMRLPPDCFG
jgi:hypothetical protein